MYIKNPNTPGPKEIYGYSNEVKPTNVQEFSMFIEFDTTDIYWFDGSTWNKWNSEGD